MIQRYHDFLNESQNKKMQKYFTFSVVLKWYRENISSIAQTLGVSADEMATEDELMAQSYGLVNHVINDQTDGNDGRNNLYGFTKFEPLEKHLIHDILHNLFHVQTKQFEKDLASIEFTESEIFEEIEVLGIEETFMKYMNIRYPKTDFINTNINMLVSYMMMAILKNDPERFGRILDGEVEPYLEIYGKQYPVKGSAFETVFQLFENTNADDKFKITSSKQLRKYLAHILNVAIGIDNSSGDRAQYPDGGYFGSKSFYDLDDEEKANFVYNNFGDKDEYYVYSDDKYKIDLDSLEMDFDIKIIKDDYREEDDNNEGGKGKNIMDFDSYYRSSDPNQLDFNRELDGKPAQKRSYVQPVALNKTSSQMNEIPVPRSAINDEGLVNIGQWFDYLANNLNVEFLDYEGNRVMVIERTDLEYKILNAEQIDEAGQEFDDNDFEDYQNSHEFTDIKKTAKQSLTKICQSIFNHDDAMSILRRNFRANDVVRNNRNMGSLPDQGYYGDKVKTIETKNKQDTHLNFVGDHSLMNKFSVSKNILSDNGKRLQILLDQLRGYMIKNYPAIKQAAKQTATVDKDFMKRYNSFDYKFLVKMTNALKAWDGKYEILLKPNYFLELDTTCPLVIIAQGMKNYTTGKRVLDTMSFEDVANIVAKNGITNRAAFDAAKQSILDITEMLGKLDLTPARQGIFSDIQGFPVSKSLNDATPETIKAWFAQYQCTSLANAVIEPADENGDRFVVKF